MESAEIMEIRNTEWTGEPLLSHWLFLGGDGYGQGFGGYSLVGEGAYIWIKGICRVLEITDFNEKNMIGKVVRVLRKEKHGTIIAIGHPYKPIWFYPEKELK